MKKLISLILALTMLFALTACGGADSSSSAGGSSAGSTSTGGSSSSGSSQQGSGNTSGGDGGSSAPSTLPAPADPQPSDISVGFLKGPTGMGAAHLIENAPEWLDVTLEAEPAAINAALISGELAAAAVPTNAASILFNKTGGNIKIAAINTLGVLYILENGNSVSSVSDLAGKTLYATGQGSNPEFVLNYILRANGLEPGEDVTVEYLASDELAAKMVSGAVDLCMLPVPAATTVLVKNADVRTALSLTDEWDAISTDGSILTQGCFVYRADLVDDVTLSALLELYETSVGFVTDAANIDAAAALMETHGIVGSAAIAKKAIPDAGIAFIRGSDEIKGYLDGYFSVMFDADPTSIGGALPGEDIYS